MCCGFLQARLSLQHRSRTKVKQFLFKDFVDYGSYIEVEVATKRGDHSDEKKKQTKRGRFNRFFVVFSHSL
jgi:hypothetical protein